jgi:hypothetical protein
MAIGPKDLNILELYNIFGLGGGNSQAVTLLAKPSRLWAPSQNGLLAEWPQRQSEMTVLPANP